MHGYTNKNMIPTNNQPPTKTPKCLRKVKPKNQGKNLFKASSNKRSTIKNSYSNITYKTRNDIGEGMGQFSYSPSLPHFLFGARFLVVVDTRKCPHRHPSNHTQNFFFYIIYYKFILNAFN